MSTSAFPFAHTTAALPPEREAGDVSARPSSFSTLEAQALHRRADGATTVELLEHLLQEAASAHASDIHVEPQESILRVRLRIDGRLSEHLTLPTSRADALTARIKVLAGLDLAEKRRPQDGRLAFSYEEPPGEEAVSAVAGSSAHTRRAIDVRVSTLPTRYGEKTVLRLLDRARLPLDFAALGLQPDWQRAIERAIERPHGLVLVTGPTGSGKTTTLYAALHHLNRVHTNLLTVEDPVEYELPGVSQTGVRADIGLTFASVLRAQLRQDPDVIMVGEIRDSETAQIAVRAALTGHLVLSTLHTNDAPSTVSRLLDVGIEPFLVASALRLVAAQRLVRKVCPHCALERELSDAERQALGLENHAVRYGEGCEACRGTGYRGRTPVMEIMETSEEIASLVGRRASTAEIRASAENAGMAGLREAARALVLGGITTPEEALRETY